jgi:hypothetical protein
VKNPVLQHWASSKEKALLAIHPRSSERGILAFSRKTYSGPALARYDPDNWGIFQPSWPLGGQAQVLEQSFISALRFFLFNRIGFLPRIFLFVIFMTKIILPLP